MLGFGSLETLQERREPCRAAVGSLGSQRKEGLRGRFVRSAQHKLPLPTVPLQFRRKKAKKVMSKRRSL